MIQENLKRSIGLLVRLFVFVLVRGSLDVELSRSMEFGGRGWSGVGESSARIQSGDEDNR